MNTFDTRKNIITRNYRHNFFSKNFFFAENFVRKLFWLRFIKVLQLKGEKTKSIIFLWSLIFYRQHNSNILLKDFY